MYQLNRNILGQRYVSIEQDIPSSVTISLKKYGYRPLISWSQIPKLTALPVSQEGAYQVDQ